MTLASSRFATATAMALAVASSPLVAQPPGSYGRPLGGSFSDPFSPYAQPSYGGSYSSRPITPSFTPGPSYGRPIDLGPSYGRTYDLGPSYGRTYDPGPSYGRTYDPGPSYFPSSPPRSSYVPSSSFPSYGPSYGPSYSSGPVYSSGPIYDSAPIVVGRPAPFYDDGFYGETVIVPEPTYKRIYPPSEPAKPASAVKYDGITWFNGQQYALVNGEKPPKDAIGYRFDGSRIHWLYEADRVALNNGTKPAELDKNRKALDARRRELLAFAESRQTSPPSAEVLRRKADAVYRLASPYVSLPEPPASLDGDDGKGLDEWIAAVDVDTYARLQALHQLASNASFDELRAKQTVWVGRCALPDAPKREDGAFFAFFPAGDSARVFPNLKPWDPKTKTFIAGQKFETLETYDGSEISQVAAKLAEGVQGFTPLVKTADGVAEMGMNDLQAVGTSIGMGYRAAFRSLRLAGTPALTVEFTIEGPIKARRPVAYCLLTKKWAF